MPRPKKGETKKEFLKRYMGSAEAVNSYPDPAQRYAVANGVWEESKKRGRKKPSQAERGKKLRKKRKRRRGK